MTRQGAEDLDVAQRLGYSRRRHHSSQREQRLGFPEVGWNTAKVSDVSQRFLEAHQDERYTLKSHSQNVLQKPCQFWEADTFALQGSPRSDLSMGLLASQNRRSVGLRALLYGVG